MTSTTTTRELAEAAAEITAEGARALHEDIKRMHIRDQERVMAGDLTATDLHLIPADMARKSVVLWTEASVCRFRR